MSSLEIVVAAQNQLLSVIQTQLDYRNAYYEDQPQEWKDGDDEGVLWQSNTEVIQQKWDDAEQARDTVERLGDPERR